MAQQQRLIPQQQGGQTKETSFNSYTFTYNWRIDDLETKLNESISSTFSSDFFSSPSGARPSTSWKLTVFTDEDADTLRLEDTPPSSPREQNLSATLKRLPYQPTRGVNSGRSTATVNYLGSVQALQLQQLGGGLHVQLGQHASTSTTSRTTPSDDSKTVWVEAILRLKPSNFADLTEFKPTSFSQGPAELSSSANSGTNVMTFKQCLPLFKVQDAQHIEVECEIKISPKVPPPTDKPNFSLSRFMEEARQNGLFTDVVLVADGKEYKAHKVVLASQSEFFSSRFSGRWVSPKADGSSGDERVNLSDVSAVIMEAMLAYMYSGKVENIGSIAYKLLPAAEEYGLVGLRQLCEEELIESLTSKTVVNMLIHAADHNALDLKKACIEFIVHNTGAVKRSDEWGKLLEDKTHCELWAELLKSIV